MSREAPRSLDEFTIERHGEVTVIAAAPSLETFDPSLVDHAATLMLEPLRQQESPLLVVDLGAVDYFGSSFRSLLLRCWRLTTSKNGQMVLAGVSSRARELLHLTSLDLVWPIYNTRREAIDALHAD
jgi:anti-anti-sigma factor